MDKQFKINVSDEGKVEILDFSLAHPVIITLSNDYGTKKARKALAEAIVGKLIELEAKRYD